MGHLSLVSHLALSPQWTVPPWVGPGGVHQVLPGFPLPKSGKDQGGWDREHPKEQLLGPVRRGKDVHRLPHTPCKGRSSGEQEPGGAGGAYYTGAHGTSHTQGLGNSHQAVPVDPHGPRGWGLLLYLSGGEAGTGRVADFPTAAPRARRSFRTGARSVWLQTWLVPCDQISLRVRPSRRKKKQRYLSI